MPRVMQQRSVIVLITLIFGVAFLGGNILYHLQTGDAYSHRGADLPDLFPG